MSLVKKFMTVGGATLGSRIFGFARETLMAAALGTGPVADVFYAAFRFPNLFRRLFAEGAFNAAFVPLFAKEIEANGLDGAKRFSEEVFGVLFSVLMILTIGMQLAMPLIVEWIIAPVFLNVLMIGALGWALWTGADPAATAWALSWSVLGAGLLQMAVVYLGVRHAGIRIGFKRPRFTPNVKRLLVLAVPAAVTGGITQINQLIGQAIASTKEGAISALQYADRIYQLPLGVVGVAVAVVLLPELARALKGGHMKEAGNLQNRAIEFVLFLTLPAAAAIWVLSDEIIRVLYERGAFSEQNTAVVASILAIYGIGLPGFVLIKALQPGYYAREDTKTPMRFTLVSVALNTGLAVTLFPIFEESGIAIAEAAAGWTNTILLFSVLLWRGHLVFEWPLITRTLRLMVASAIMAGLLVYLSDRWSGWLSPQSPLFDQLLALGGLIAIAMPVYFGVAFAIGGADLGMIRRNLKRKPKSAQPADARTDDSDQQ